MNAVPDKGYKWIWPFVGGTSTNQDINSEMFDRTDHPWIETFVREAIQNSIDARLDLKKPVTMNFAFHERDVEEYGRFLSCVMEFRRKAGLDVPQEWINNKIRYLLVEDFNTTGLTGNLQERASDFWHYWLNFGQSNKGGTNLGGRGIGRVTFLIASHIRAVIGYTRRKSDGKSAICGMAMLEAQPDGKGFRSTHAYFANKEDGPIYQLHCASELENELPKAFGFTGYRNEFSSGFALAIPYPKSNLTPERIMAAAIENFAPAIINRTLVVNSGKFHLDSNSIEEIGTKVRCNFISAAIKQNPERYFQLIQQGLKRKPSHEITILNPYFRKEEYETLRESEEIQKIQKSLTINHTANQAPEILDLKFPLERNGKKINTRLRIVIATAPSRVLPFDRLFRAGMCLPDVRSKNPGEFDLIVLARGKYLVEYLNLCEGKAHLDLLESEEVKQKLKQRGFDELGVRRLVKFLPSELRQLLTPSIAKPDPNVLLDFFSIPIAEPEPESPPPQPPKPPEPPPLPPPTPLTFIVDKVDDGLCIRANPTADNWPANLLVVLAYADGTRRPDRSWDPLDFNLNEFNIKHTGIGRLDRKDNQIALSDCDSNFTISITGFDQNRELDVSVKDN